MAQHVFDPHFAAWKALVRAQHLLELAGEDELARRVRKLRFDAWRQIPQPEK